MATIRDILDQLRRIQANAEASAAKVEADWRLSDAAKKEARDGLRSDMKDAVNYAATSIFGKVGPNGLEGGAFWTQREALRAKVKEARDRADTLDPVRLGNTYRRIGAVVSRFRTVGDLEAWYNDQADTFEKRALQDMASETIGTRFRIDPAVGGFLATLERDRTESLRTPDLVSAETSVAALEAEAYDAHVALSGWASTLGMGHVFSVDPAARTLRSVRVDKRFEDVSRPDSKMRTTVEKVDAGGVYWSGDVPEA